MGDPLVASKVAGKHPIHSSNENGVWLFWATSGPPMVDLVAAHGGESFGGGVGSEGWWWLVEKWTKSHWKIRQKNLYNRGAG